MKTLKYVIALLAMVAVSASFTSCDRENDITGNPIVDPNTPVNGKQMYWMEFSLSNPGTLESSTVTLYKINSKGDKTPYMTYTGTQYLIRTFNEVVYGVEGNVVDFINNEMYVTEDYARTNFNKLISLSAEENDLVQKVIRPVAIAAKTRDFELTVTLTRNDHQEVLGTNTWKAADYVTVADITPAGE
ncbi:MAG: hypothetical protein IJV17_05125 [Prevotella sp.]|nr:hypothetical protein [Prevotella sp.]